MSKADKGSDTKGEKPVGSKGAMTTTLELEGFGTPDGLPGTQVETPSGSIERVAPPVEERLEFSGPEGKAWRVATGIVNRFRPVPWLLWVMIRGVYGRSAEVGTPDAMSFSAIEKLLIQAATDRTLGKPQDKENPRTINLQAALSTLGMDVAGALCFIHAVCRRVSTSITDKVSRPILDDALLRTHIGYHVGSLSPNCGAGRGMLAGFSGRSGLAILIGSGTLEQGQKALTGLASGVEISKVCSDVYGCDPLKVAALSLIAGGCSRDIAYGIASFSSKTKDVLPGTEQFRWLALFTVIEHLRMGRNDQITDEYWHELGYDPARRAELAEAIQQSQRRGHGWKWITQPLTAPEEAPKA